MSDPTVTGHRGCGIVVRGNDIDTDRIIPARFLRCVTFDGLGEHAFEDDRAQAKGDHPLDDERFAAARLLVVGQNFGSGSSREHAPWALQDFGIQAVISSSYADIFYNNSFKNGMLLIKLPPEQVDELMAVANDAENPELTVDLENQKISAPNGVTYDFDLDPFLKRCLLEGLDDIGQTLQKDSKIVDYESKQRLQQPWLYKAAS